MPNGNDPFQLNDAAKQAMQQTQQAVDTYFDFLKQTILSSPTGGTEFGKKIKSVAEQNINAAHEYMKKLSQARDFQDMMRIQTEFMQTQLKAFGDQSKSLTETTVKMAADATKNR